MIPELIASIESWGRPRVLVIGDVMLDRYVWGDAARISQEAPVLLLQADRRDERLGGAGSVAMMLRALDADVALAGIAGDDADGGRVRALLRDMGIDDRAVIAVPDRPTTVKERYIGRAQQKHPQQILRVDYECREPLPAAAELELLHRLGPEIAACSVVLISDYDKGVCSPRLIERVVAAARAAGKRVLADPARGVDYRRYRGCSAITPNRLEAALAVRDLSAGDAIRNPQSAIRNAEDALAAADRLREELELDAAIVTLDKDGMAASAHGCREHFPTRARQVYDITGAGDMVLSVLGMAIAAGADYSTAVRLANVAGGLEVEKLGVAAVTREEIVADLRSGGARAAGKLLALPNLLDELERRRRSGFRVAFTNGCFDVIHAGHVQYLAEARRQADLLIVGLNDDASVRGLKGPDRPIHPLEARALVLCGLEAVDFVVAFADATPMELIRAIRPDVLVKGADYRKSDVVGADFVESYGGRVHLAALRDGYSTTNALNKLRAA